jgi:hypothetical protein
MSVYSPRAKPLSEKVPAGQTTLTLNECLYFAQVSCCYQQAVYPFLALAVLGVQSLVAATTLSSLLQHEVDLSRNHLFDSAAYLVGTP